MSLNGMKCNCAGICAHYLHYPVILNLFSISYPFTNKITRFTPNTLNGTHLSKIRIKKLLQFRMFYKNLHWLQFMIQ